MSEAKLELVFYGELAEGFSLEQAKKNIAELFKANVEQVERMFTGKRVVIRNKLDAETAQKYVVAMRKRGALCKVEGADAPSVTQSPTSSAPTATSTEAQTVASRAPQTEDVKAFKRAEPAREGALQVAGEKVDEILAGIDLTVDPVGVRLSEEQIVAAPIIEGLDNIDLAPVGSVLQDEKEDVPVSVPDTSHLSVS